MAASLSDGKLLLMCWVGCQVLALLVRGGGGGQEEGQEEKGGGVQKGGPFNPVR